uniref:Uncharacterized protein n=1 Tax=Arundo donax TaxID=35708 RepID=A0A0A9H886_ARUDO
MVMAKLNQSTIDKIKELIRHLVFDQRYASATQFRNKNTTSSKLRPRSAISGGVSSQYSFLVKELQDFTASYASRKKERKKSNSILRKASQ